MSLQNRLSCESSPYLLQHAQNPVAWQSWNAESFALAKKLDRPIFLSIGYSTCYWCHVMEHDSFESEQVAEVLNQRFLPIKLDREERPDVDERFMQVVLALSGHGGWPLSVFLTPDLRAFWGGTFFYRAQFLDVLDQISHAWSSRREDVLKAASHLGELTLETSGKASTRNWDGKLLRKQVYEVLQNNWDTQWGGFQGAPKFPPSPSLHFLLSDLARNPRTELRSLVEPCLDGMAKGGIFDHLGGGFSRYSVDEHWTVPHFEKMLYDNAQLAALYAEASVVLGRADYAEIARSTFDFVLRDLAQTGTGFFTALDAGEVEREGEFYVWDHSDLQRLLSVEQLGAMGAAYDLNAEGNFEGKIVLRLRPQVPLSVRMQLLEPRELLCRERRKRPAPRCDDKVLTGLNGLMLSSLCMGARCLQEPHYLAQAEAMLRTLLANAWSAEGLYRSGRGEKAIPALAEDYAYLIAACLDLFESSGALYYFTTAESIQRSFDEKFLSDQGYYVDTRAPELVPRAASVQDHVLPSVQAVALENLSRFFALTGEICWRERQERLGAWLQGEVAARPLSATRALEALDFEPSAAYVFLSPSVTEAWVAALRSRTRLHVLRLSSEHGVIPALASKALESRACAWVCKSGACTLPIQSLIELQAGLLESSLDITTDPQ